MIPPYQVVYAENDGLRTAYGRPKDGLWTAYEARESLGNTGRTPRKALLTPTFLFASWLAS
jgi:hypothetical protein